MLGGDHVGTVGDQVLILAGIKAVVGGLPGAYTQNQFSSPVLLPNPASGGFPEDVPGGLAHEGADGMYVRRSLRHES